MTMSADCDIAGPYSADEHTRLLYHFEEAPDDFESAGDPGNPISNFGSKGSALSLTDTGGPDGRDNKGGGGYAAEGAPGMGHALPGNEPAVRTVEFNVNTSAPTAVIPPQIYGQFMEDFGHAFEGGIHAEKIRGMGFEGDDFTSFWKAFTDDAAEGSAQVVEGSTPSGRKCLSIDVRNGSAGARQERFHLEQGRSYGGSVWVIAEAGEPALSLRIRGVGTVDVPLGVPGREWKEVRYRFNCTATDANAVLEIVATGSGRAGVDFISLMAEDDRAAGMTRKDLREGVEALRPTFIRFPGGSHASHYHWKDAIGPPHLRPYVLNESWDYHIYNLLGTDEFMNLCKHLKAEPMIVFNATDHSTKDIDQRTVPLLDDALDWVRYLTDPPTGKWGAMRAANGRREPWSVPYFQIDNEPMNFGMGGTAYAKLINRWSPSIRAAAPKSQIIACGQKRDPDLAFSKQVIDGAGANFEILGVHNYEYTESAYFTGVRRIGNYLRDLRDFIHQSAHPHIKIGVLEWGMSVGKSSMDWRSGIHAAGSLMLYESMSEDITMTCPAVFMRQKGYVRWGYGASLMFNHKTSWPSGGYAVGKLFREHYHPERIAYLEGDVDAIATRSADGKVLVVKAVNYTDRPVKLDLRLTGSQVSADAVVRIREIASSLTAECTAEQSALFEPRESSAKNSGGLVHELAPHSVAVIEFRSP